VTAPDARVYALDGRTRRKARPAEPPPFCSAYRDLAGDAAAALAAVREAAADPAGTGAAALASQVARLAQAITGMGAAELAVEAILDFGRAQGRAEVLGGRRGISPEAAAALMRRFGVPEPAPGGGAESFA
jgi:hypothetical protein